MAGMSRSLLAVVAHPDDESFGLGSVLARFVSDGDAISLLCLTHGEASTLGRGAEDRDPDDRGAEDRASGQDAGLGRIRRVELQEAAAQLGLTRVWLEDYPDGRLAEVPEAELDRVVAQRVGAARGLIVFEPGGVTGHPDHRAATATATRVAMARGLDLIEWGLAAEVARRLRAEFGVPFVALGEGPGLSTLRVDRRAQLAAIACHRSQLVDNPVVRRRLALQGDLECVRLRPAASA
jgi:N-acetylglucosamine malate deacetylase 2